MCVQQLYILYKSAVSESHLLQIQNLIVCHTVALNIQFQGGRRLQIRGK